MFEPIEGRRESVCDPETGIEISLRALPDYEKEAIIHLPDGREFSCFIQIVRRSPERPFLPNDPSNPMILLLMNSLKTVAECFGGSFEENTRFVNLILSGLSTINRIWPLSLNPFFYSDRQSYVGLERSFPFTLPSEEEIANL
jgi:hypothetical protein